MNHLCLLALSLRAGSLRLGLTAHEALQVMDHLWDLEMSWQDGNTVPQTVFTCLYVQAHAIGLLRQYVGQEKAFPGATADAPEAPVVSTPSLAEAGVASPAEPGTAEHTVALALLAYCTSLLRTMALLRAVFFSADVYEVRPRHGCCAAVALCFASSVRLVTSAAPRLTRDHRGLPRHRGAGGGLLPPHV